MTTALQCYNFQRKTDVFLEIRRTALSEECETRFHTFSDRLISIPQFITTEFMAVLQKYDKYQFKSK